MIQSHRFLRFASFPRSGVSQFAISVVFLANYFVDHIAMNVGQTKVATLVAEGQSLMVHAE